VFGAKNRNHDCQNDRKRTEHGNDQQSGWMELHRKKMLKVCGPSHRKHLKLPIFDFKARLKTSKSFVNIKNDIKLNNHDNRNNQCKHGVPA
jgi:hypothetical protein